ncbi:hypothetical protein RN001_008412 [Aquatica leii]|uniref:Cilia- and flagella-associated protein 69 ARM repeats domain-containing protein n=1 Tax=Aquatica leii TaxID=1421715 RepID=A0AAN7PF58_9COLE|nr:hypothetical protein RN001_008412 [Aquatica leii]
MPPLINKTSDAAAFARDLEEYFSFLGYCLVHVRDVEIRECLLKALVDVLDRRLPTSLNCITKQTCCDCVKRSEFPIIVTKLLEIADPDLYEKLLDISLILTNLSVTICHRMIKEHAIDFILFRLMEPNTVNKNDPLPRNHDISCRTLWVLLSSCKYENNDFQRHEYCPKDFNLRNLKDLLRVLTKCNNQINRNYVMAVILLFMDLFPNFPLISSGLASDIGILCAAAEIGSGGTWLSEVSFGTNENDYEFKKMLILAVCYSAKVPNGIKILHPKRIIPSLLRIITPELTQRWHPQQLEKLISMALSALQMIVETLPEDFLRANGPLRLLMMIEYYHIQPYEISVLKNCLKALHTISFLNNSDILNDLLINGSQGLILNIVVKLLKEPSLTLDCQQCLMYGFSTLEMLFSCGGSSHEQTVEISMTFLQRILKPKPKDPLLNPKFLISGIGFLWETMVWNENSLRKFTSDGGVYMLLDVIYQYSLPIKVIGLGVLVDMCDIGFCIPHLITWRNKGKKLLPLLLEIFRQENLRMGVKSTYDGMIADIEIPLMGHQQWYETFDVEKDPDSSPATVDLLGSCRPKIYAIINLLNNRHEFRVKVSNNHYKLFDTTNLTTIDKITMLLAENFLALKLGEAWIEVSQDIDKSGIRPLAIDEAFMALLKRRFLKWSQHLQISQEKMLEKQLIREYNYEMSLYNLLRESRLIESLYALHELEYIARTTERMFRLMSKMKQSKEIERTSYNPTNGTYHTTYLHKLKVTPVFQQYVSIQSDIISDPNGDSSVSLVSVTNSTEL